MGRLPRWLGYALLGGLVAAAVLAACAPAAGGASGAFVGVTLCVGLFGLVAPMIPGLRRTANAGAPVPCSGYTETYCGENGYIGTHCCPAGAKCNYRDEPFLPCGDRLCTSGGDIGRCPSPQPTMSDAKSEADCKTQYGSWELVCAQKVVVAACLPGMPTNYTGPGQSPHFELCGRGPRLISTKVEAGERCTTHRLVEDCYPTQAELGASACLGALTKVCLGGKVSERCLPASLPWEAKRTWQATTFVDCGSGRCAVGDDKTKACAL